MVPLQNHIQPLTHLINCLLQYFGIRIVHLTKIALSFDRKMPMEWGQVRVESLKSLSEVSLKRVFYVADVNSANMLSLKKIAPQLPFSQFRIISDKNHLKPTLIIHTLT